MIQSAANMDFTSFLVVILVMVFCAVAVSKLTDLLAEDLSPPKWSGPNYPILGHLPAMIPYSKAFKAHAFFYRVLQESGPVVTVNMFTRKVVVTSNADAAKQILTNGDYFCIRPTFLQEKFEGIAKNALFVLPSGEIWRKHRKLLQPAFGPAHLRHAFDATMSFSRVLFDKVWNQHVESDTPFNVHRHMSCLTADVIGQVAFSYEFQLVPNLLTPDSERMKAIHHLDNLLVIVVRKFMPDWIKFLFGVKLPKDEGSLEKLKEMFKSVIDEKISKAKKENSGGSEQDKNKDVLDRLMVHDDSAPEKSFSQEELMDEMFAFFLAGHETTANTITFALLELCRNPDCFKKLREEADSILSSPSTEDNQSSSTTPNALSYERVGEFKYAEAVIKEALRLHPVVSGIPRQTAKDVLLGGFVVRKGTQVSISIRALHHSRDYWTDPLEYQPSRWLKEGFAPVPGSYLPFGDGPMNCIGQKMAMMEARLLVAFIARNYDLEPIPGQDLDPITTITTGLKNGLMMKAKKRKM